MLQPENEYTFGEANVTFPNADYFQAVEDMYRNNGIVVPFVSNDAAPLGRFAPGTGKGEVDIYGHDGYPLGFDCANPYTWPDNSIPTVYLADHLAQSPSTPFTISEFQGGSFDPWGGQGFAKCTALLGPEFERVFYKNNYAVKVAIFNLYMVYGGTNWGNLGHPGGYTSYDYGSIIAEDRTVAREKYSELKLQANVLKVTPAYLVATPGNTTNGSSYVNTPLIATTRLTTNTTNFYVIRHAAYNTFDSTNYQLSVSTSLGDVTIPQLNGTLTLNGRDSKIHVTDYAVGAYNMLYSSAEIFTWKASGNKTVVVLYGGPNESHEAAFVGQKNGKIIEGTGVTTKSKNGTFILSWAVTPERKIVKFSSGLYVYLLDRYEAYNYWAIDIPAASPADNYTTSAPKSILAKAGYLLRTATVDGSNVALTGDINATTTIEVINGAPAGATLTFNGKTVKTTTDKNGVIKATVEYVEPSFDLPGLSGLTWKYIDSLPEIQPTYDDSAWVAADHASTNNTKRNLTTPTSLYSSDYGFNTGNLLTRGVFTAAGNETGLSIETQGGSAYASAVYLNDTQISGFAGSGDFSFYTQNITLPTLTAGANYILTVLTDNMGLDEDFTVGDDTNKNPRGILDYTLIGRDDSAVTWKITGNLGGEDYRDRTRGPLNEGGLFAERQGYHLPNPPTTDWTTSSPFEGISKPGVGFYTTSFDLDAPAGYDIPLAFVFTNTTGANYRAQLYVNGYQFGKYGELLNLPSPFLHLSPSTPSSTPTFVICLYVILTYGTLIPVNNIGPQTSFPVPEGILNYHGTNYIALSLWSFDAEGSKLGGLEVAGTAKIMSGYKTIANSPMPAWEKREGAY